jgi:glycosyltransferase involved in cell wall biosynthesis
MIEAVENPTFKSRDFDSKRKKPGVSVILRLRNEEEYLEQALESIWPIFDEFVVVYNQCTDRTPEIVETFAGKDPQRFKAFHYLPPVYPPYSSEHRELPSTHVSSLDYYYNFALSRVSYRICTKWDGDMIAAPETLGRVVDQLRAIKPWSSAWWFSPWKLGYWWYVGVNLWDRDGKVFVARSHPVANRNRDFGFWPVRRWNIYRHHPHFEYLRIRLFKHRFLGYLFFHVKGMKRERGLGIYWSEGDLSSPYKQRMERIWTDPELIPFEEYCRINPAARHLPSPETLGIRPVIVRTEGAR